MIGFDLLKNYTDNLEALLKKTRARVKKVLTVDLEDS
jgi:hypothetical protein